MNIVMLQSLYKFLERVFIVDSVNSISALNYVSKLIFSSDVHLTPLNKLFQYCQACMIL